MFVGFSDQFKGILPCCFRNNPLLAKGWVCLWCGVSRGIIWLSSPLHTQSALLGTAPENKAILIKCDASDFMFYETSAKDWNCSLNGRVLTLNGKNVGFHCWLLIVWLKSLCPIVAMTLQHDIRQSFIPTWDCGECVSRVGFWSWLLFLCLSLLFCYFRSEKKGRIA